MKTLTTDDAQAVLDALPEARALLRKLPPAAAALLVAEALEFWPGWEDKRDDAGAAHRLLDAVRHLAYDDDGHTIASAVFIPAIGSVHQMLRDLLALVANKDSLREEMVHARDRIDRALARLDAV